MGIISLSFIVFVLNILYNKAHFLVTDLGFKMITIPQSKIAETTDTDTEKVSDPVTAVSKLKAEATKNYVDYALSQRGFTPPVAHISQEKEDDDRTEVHIDTKYGDHSYHFRSIKPIDAEAIYKHLNSQPIVRAKFGNTKTVDLATTVNWVKKLSARFSVRDSDEGSYMYGGLVVSDNEDDTFLGYVNMASSEVEGIADIMRLNRADSWSQPIKSSVVEEYKASEDGRLKKSYQGLGTAETSVLVQYAHYLRANNHKLKGKSLEGICATARLDNPGSWKSSAKLGFELTGIDSNPKYGPELRYQLRKMLKSR